MAEQIVGISLAGCKIIKLLGKGGMGSVYLGRQVDLGRFVAVKVLSKNLIQEEGFLRRFKREARSVASLSHPHIVQVYQYGEEEGIHFIVMEYVEGDTLGAKISGGKTLPESEGIRLVKQAAIGIQEAQKKNIVHRDIKPDNIILDKMGDVKVTDFGLAKNLSGGADQSLVTKQIIGTPAYISPEQIKGSDVDPRSDLYSLGATFYHLLVGKPPFTAKNPFELLEKHLKEKPVPPKEVRPELSEGVSQVILKCLAKDPKRRYQSCAELIEDLEQIEGGSKVIRTGVMKAGLQGWPVRLAGAAVFVALIAWVGVRLSSSEGPPDPPPVAGNGNGDGGNGTGNGDGGNGSTNPPVPTVLPKAEAMKKFLAMVTKAKVWEEKGKLEVALEKYREAQEIMPDDAEVAARIVEIESRIEEERKYREQIEHFRDVKDKGIQALMEFTFQDKQLRDYKLLDDAIASLQEANKIDPKDHKVSKLLRQALRFDREREQAGNGGGNGGTSPGPGPGPDDPTPEEGDLPEPPFKGTLFLKTGGYLTGIILEMTEEKVVVATHGGKVTRKWGEIDELKAKGIDFRVAPDRIKELLNPKKVEFKFQVPHKDMGGGWVEVRYDFSDPMQLKDWTGAANLNADERSLVLGRGSILKFGMKFQGAVEIEVEVKPVGEGTFQVEVYDHNVSISTQPGIAPGLWEGWDMEAVAWEGDPEECPVLTPQAPSRVIVRRGKDKEVYISADFGDEIRLKGEIPGGLGEVGFRAQGTGFFISHVVLTGRPRP